MCSLAAMGRAIFIVFFSDLLSHETTSQCGSRDTPANSEADTLEFSAAEFQKDVSELFMPQGMQTRTQIRCWHFYRRSARPAATVTRPILRTQTRWILPKR